MIVLAVDTTTPRGSVAVVRGGELLGEVRVFHASSHSTRLLPAIDFLLSALGLPPQQLGGYAVASGPGSFTGLRVGISTVQGLALASRRPCLGIPALDVLAARIEGAAEHLVAMIDAFREEVFAAVYDTQARLRGERVLAPPACILDRLSGPAAFIGDGAERYRRQIANGCPGALWPRRSLFLAGTLGRLAEPRLEAGEGVDPGSLTPLYLREASIRKPAS